GLVGSGRGVRSARRGRRRPADAEDPLPRQAGRRARQGEEDGEHPSTVAASAPLPVADLLEHAAPLDDVLVVPLDGPGLSEPALQIARLELCCIGDAKLRSLELALGLEAWF